VTIILPRDAEGKFILIKAVLIFLIVSWVFPGCRTETPIENDLETPTPDGTSFERQNELPVTASAVETSTNSPLVGQSDPPIIEQCRQEREVEVEQLLLEEKSSLIVSQGEQTRPLWRMNFTEQITMIPMLASTDYIQLELSPNGKWIAYSTYDEQDTWDLVLLSADGNEQEIIIDNLPSEFRRFSWVSDEKIVLLYSVLSPGGERIGRPTEFVNPFTRQVVEIPDFPLSIHQSAIWIGPNGENALFISADTHEWVLYNIQTGEMTLLLPVTGLARAAWAPYNPIVGIFSSDLYIFDIEKEINNKALGLPLPTGGVYAIEAMAWDNSGEKLAFEIRQSYESEVGNTIPLGLYVFDKNTDSITYYCMVTEISSQYGLHWSPDSRFIAWTTDNPPAVIILDVEHNQSAKLANTTFLGWAVGNNE
jgi:hypothetical protein